MATKPLDTHSWARDSLSFEDMRGVFDRMEYDFPTGTRVAWSTKVGNWDHDLRVGKMEDAKRFTEGSDVFGPHIAFSMCEHAMGILPGDGVSFSHDYAGARMVIRSKNGYGDQIEWIIVRVDEED